MELAIASHIPVSEWRAELDDDPRIIATANQVLEEAADALKQATEGR